MPKVNRSVVRNQGYSRGQASHIERHNERKNERYGNSDVDLRRVHMNVHFKQPKGTYLQTFDQLLDNGIISTRGLKDDAKIIGEMIFDVNTEYFELMGEEIGVGGYEYAKSFFAEAYKIAVKEVAGDYGEEYGEQFILSATMHADERNKALSEQLGKDVYHYHLHVVYIPIVQKEVRWSKRCKDPALVGTVKEVINQVSHGKKWKSETVVEPDGKKRLVYSYSLLQDRFYEHMKDAGFVGFERGERGSTAEHLSVLDYKIKQDEARVSSLTDEITKQAKQSATLIANLTEISNKTVKLDNEVKKKQKHLAEMDKKLAIKQKAEDDIASLDAVGRKNLVGQMVLSPEEFKGIKRIIKREAVVQEENLGLSDENSKLRGENSRLRKKLHSYEGKGVTDQMEYFQARQRAPKRLSDTVADILRQPAEGREQQQYQQHPNRQYQSTPTNQKQLNNAR